MTETTEKKGRGRPKGPQGPRQWKDKPTPRERVMGQSLAQYIKNEIGRDISTETIRAVRFWLPRWWKDPVTQSLRDNMDHDLKKATLQEKREKHLEQLREIESELTKFEDSESDEDEENGEEDEVDEYEDDVEDDEDDEDVFDESDEKVSAKF